MKEKEYIIEEHDVTILDEETPKKKKCTKCSKVKKTVTWLGILSIGILGLSIYGLVELIGDLIQFITK
jgi:hypothetical protein